MITKKCLHLITCTVLITCISYIFYIVYTLPVDLSRLPCTRVHELKNVYAANVVHIIYKFTDLPVPKYCYFVSTFSCGGQLENRMRIKRRSRWLYGPKKRSKRARAAGDNGLAPRSVRESKSQPDSLANEG